MQYLAILFYAMISTSYCRMNTQASNSPLLTEDVARNIESLRPLGQPRSADLNPVIPMRCNPTHNYPMQCTTQGTPRLTFYLPDKRHLVRIPDLFCIN